MTGELVPRRLRQLPAIRNFSTLEPVLQKLASTREAVALADSSTRELLEQIDAALTLVEQHRPDLQAIEIPATVVVIGTYLTALSEARPNAGQQDHEFYSRTLRDDVMSLSPSEGALEVACRRWRQRSNFMPTIAEMMEEVRVASLELHNAADFVRRLPGLRESVAARLQQV